MTKQDKPTEKIDSFSFSVSPAIVAILKEQGEAVVTLDGELFRIIKDSKYEQSISTIRREAVGDNHKYIAYCGCGDALKWEYNENDRTTTAYCLGCDKAYIVQEKPQ